MKRGSIFETDGIPHMSEALPLAMQHVVAMIVGCVTPAIIVSGAVPGGLSREDQVILIQSALVIAALSTLLQLFRLAERRNLQLAQACLLSWVSALLRAKYAGDSGIVWNSSNHGCGDCWWYRSSCYGFAGQEDSDIFPAANYRNSRIYHRSFPVSDCH